MQNLINFKYACVHDEFLQDGKTVSTVRPKKNSKVHLRTNMTYSFK